MKTVRKIPLVVWYTAMFVVIATITYSGLFLAGRTLIWEVDGIAQHFPILLEFQRILQHHPQQLFSWSWNLGLGADQLTTFSYYVVGDPFNYLVVFVSRAHLEWAYQALILLRLYFVGLAFLGFSRQFKFKRVSQLIGALTYTFTAYTFYVGMHHPFFLLPMIWFPLLCWAIERVLRGRHWLPLSLITAVVILSNFYFAYLLALGGLIYALVRYWSRRRDHLAMRSFGQLFWRLLVAVGLGVMMAGVLLVPSLLAMLTATRASFNFANGLTSYPINYYVNLPNRLLTNGGSVQYWVTLGLSSISFIAIIYTLRHFKRYWVLNWVLVVMMIGILLPQFAAVFNVFSTPSNRWLLMATLVFAYATMAFMDQVTALTAADLKWLAGISGGLLVVIWLINGFYLNIRKHDIATYLILLAFIGILLAKRSLKLTNRQFYVLLLGVVTLNLANNGLGWLSINTNSNSTEQLRQGAAMKWVKNYFDGAQKSLSTTGQFYRTALAPNYYTMRSAESDVPMVLGTHTVGSYFSVQNGYVGAFSQALGNSEYAMNSPLGSLDGRTTMYNLLGVKYLFAREDQLKNQALPAGYEVVKMKTGEPKIFADKFIYGMSNHTGTILLKSKNALPLVYTQRHQISQRQFNQLSAVDREQALLQGAVTTQPVSGVKTVKPAVTGKNVAYTVQADTTNVLDTLDKVIIYRNQHATGASNNVLTKLPADTITLTPEQRESLTPATGLTKPSNRVLNLIAANQKLVQKNQENNANGLTSMVSDVQGHQMPYQLTIQHPKKYRNTELYLVLDGISYRRSSIKHALTTSQNTNVFTARPYTKVDYLNDVRDGLKGNLSASGYSLTAQTTDNLTSFSQLGTTNMSDYEPRTSAVINLGYSKHARKLITLNYTSIRSLHFKSAKLIAVPLGKTYRQRTRQLQASGLKHQQVTNDQITGTTTTNAATVLTTSIPYSTGWQLQVDGRTVKTQVVNKGFVGAKLTAGHHRIRLTYHTPGLKIGVWLSFIGGVISILIACWWWIRKRGRSL
ncbi:YfhO family protein [Lactiplantibacillus argentoratensis]|uniref:YfhO family protein n=1 Tax=Lactiplantibacillus argentoratensis TaxID=271881 RepID=A0ABS5UII4_9LACO|nr:YfhO family protein [Lactiplantibacillus argentoratensis]MBT1138394.1 YfhO family protein [Lactiplantibacillus argentoratensis]MBT1141250.1 YfhO family protein [Lactiplantibacillus argentoratensis]